MGMSLGPSCALSPFIPYICHFSNSISFVPIRVFYTDMPCAEGDCEERCRGEKRLPSGPVRHVGLLTHGPEREAPTLAHADMP